MEIRASPVKVPTPEQNKPSRAERRIDPELQKLKCGQGKISSKKELILASEKKVNSSFRRCLSVVNEQAIIQVNTFARNLFANNSPSAKSFVHSAFDQRIPPKAA